MNRQIEINGQQMFFPQTSALGIMLGNVSTVTEGHENIVEKIVSLMNSTAAATQRSERGCYQSHGIVIRFTTTQFIIIMILMMQLHFSRDHESLERKLSHQLLDVSFQFSFGIVFDSRFANIGVLPDAWVLWTFDELLTEVSQHSWNVQVVEQSTTKFTCSEHLVEQLFNYPNWRGIFAKLTCCWWLTKPTKQQIDGANRAAKIFLIFLTLFSTWNSTHVCNLTAYHFDL